MHLSILVASHRHDLRACSRIAQACSWAGPQIEVIVRDNSADIKKRDLLSCFRRENCTIVFVDPCGGLENIVETLRLATGDFVYFIADDDFCFDHTIAALPSIIDSIRAEPSIAGVTGSYIVEESQGSSFVNYSGIDSDDAVMRVTGYLKHQGANVLYYSPFRREMLKHVFATVGAMPFSFSFHDQIICLLSLLNGKFFRIQRPMYLYDNCAWERPDLAQRKDVDFYVAAGLDAAIHKLHWFLCAYEGAVLIHNSDLFPAYLLPQRQLISDLWFSAMFGRFKHRPRLTFESQLSSEADKLCARLLTMAGQIPFNGMLSEICNFMALSSKPGAKAYFDFWDRLIEKRSAVA
jgi:hypothetical protein